MSLLRFVREVFVVLALAVIAMRATADSMPTKPTVHDPLVEVKRATIAIGWRDSTSGTALQASSLQIACSGFLYQHTPPEFMEGKSEPDATGSVYYWARIWVVTAAHCIRDRSEIIARINSKTGSTIIYEISANRWAIHPTHDVAVAGLSGPSGNTILNPAEEAQLLDTDIRTLTSRLAASKEQLLRFGLFEYTPVAIVGFPLGRHRSGLRNYPLVRGGRIAQIQGYLDGDPNHGTFLVAGSVFGGNSGGPVIIPKGTRSLDGSRQLSDNILVGLVSYGQVTMAPVRESLDLAGVAGMDAVHEVIHQLLARKNHQNSQ